MKYKTLSQITQDVIYEASQVPGVSVQTYSEPVIQRRIQHVFDDVFSRGWWPQFTTYQRQVFISSWYGYPTLDFTVSPVIDGIEDIRWIFRANHPKPLVRLPTFANKDLLSGTTLMYWEPYAAMEKLFRIYPIIDEGQAAAEDTSTYSVYVTYRSHPPEYAEDSEVAFDNLYLMYAVLADLLSSDADNMDNAKRFEGKAASRLTLLYGLNSGEIPTGPSSGTILTDWSVL